MIQVGIHEGIELIKAELNDKGTLVIGLKKGDGEMSLEDQLNSGSDASSAKEEQEFYIWPLALGEYVKTGTDIFEAAESLKRSLTHILKGYLKEDDIKWNVLNGIEIKTTTDVDSKLMIEDNISKLYNNIITQFIEMVTPFIGKGHLFRVKLNRQSKLKSFSSLPKVGKFAHLDTEGFWESMDVKKEASNVKYNRYELGFRKGDKTTPSGVDISSSAQVAEASEPDAQEVDDVNEMFKETPQEG